MAENERPTGLWKRRLRRWGVLAAAVYLVWLGALYSQQSRMVFPRQFSGPAMKEGRLPARVESMWINPSTGKGTVKVEAWYLPASTGVSLSSAGAPGRSPLLIYCHGNAELIDDCMGVAMEWSRRGFAVLIPEYRGYGRS